MKPALIYITDGFPYNKADVFSGDELPFLVEQDWDIYILHTSKVDDEKAKISDSVQVFDDLVVSKKQKFKALLSPEALKLLYDEYQSYKAKNLKIYLEGALGAIATSLTVKRKLFEFIIANGLDKRPLVIYSYWCNSTAFGASLLNEKLNHVKFVSRVHGYDLFPGRYKKRYLPFRFLRIKRFNAIVAVSKAGIQQLLEDGHKQDKIALYHLGVPEPRGPAASSSNGSLSLISCSNMADVKRLPLLVRSIKNYVQNRKELNVSWQHFGGGKGFEDFQELVSTELKSIPQLSFKLYGHLPVGEVREKLAQGTADALINVSLSEGGVPVSLQEAGCCGIPLIATDAGGSSEIVNDKTGVLLPLQFTQEEFNQALDQMKEWKKGACRTQVAQFCRDNFSQSINYPKFVNEVLVPQFVESAKKLK